jgi:hypothetical protein
MQSKTPNSDEEFLQSTSRHDIMTAKQKRMFKIGATTLMDEILESTRSDQQSSIRLSETSTTYIQHPG